MKVKELIKHLQKEDPNAIVVTTTDNFEMGHATIEAKYIRTFKGDIKSEGFRDAFDGGSYSAEVVRRNDDGKKTFVQIS